MFGFAYIDKSSNRFHYERRKLLMRYKDSRVKRYLQILDMILCTNFD